MFGVKTNWTTDILAQDLHLWKALGYSIVHIHFVLKILIVDAL